MELVFIQRVSADIRGFVNSVVIFVGIHDCTNTSEKQKWTAIAVFFLFYSNQRENVQLQKIYICVP